MLGSDVLRDFIRLDDLVGDLNETAFELAQLFNEHEFQPLKIFLFFRDAQSQLLELLLKKVLFQFYSACQLFTQGYKQRIYL